MSGILGFGNGGLPPGLAGFVAAEEMGQRRKAQGLQGALGILNMQNLAQEMEGRAEMRPLQQEQLRITLEQARQNAALRGILQGQLSGGPATPQGALAAGAAQGDVGPTVTNAGRIGMLGGPGGGGGGMMAGVNPMAAALALSGDAGMGKLGGMIQDANKPLAAREGAPVINPATGQIMFYAPKLETGMMPQFSGGQITGVSNIPGFVPAMTERTTATEGAKAPFKIQERMIGGRPVTMSDADYATLYGPDQLKAVQVAQRYGIPYNGGPITGAPPVAAPTAAPAPAPAPTPVAAPPAQPGASGIGTIPTANVIGGPRVPVNPTAAEARLEAERAETAARREREAPQGALQTGSQFDSFKRLTDMATQVLNARGLGGAVGLRGAFPSVPGSNASSAEALIDSLKSQVSGMKLQAMRDASKTGGAVGNVTEKEWPRLEAMVVALNPRLDKESFKGQVNNLIDEILISERRIADAYKQEYGNTRGAVPPATRAGGLTAQEQAELATLRARFSNGR